MAVFAIGDVQGCDQELGALLDALDFRPARDRLWFVGDLVNRGPDSLAVLRRVRDLGDAATVVLGNHDLHLLAVAAGAGRMRGDDTLDEIMRAPDREELLAWLLARPLLHEDESLGYCMLHAGLAPQWDLDTARRCAREFEHALRRDPRALFDGMYGDRPDRWDEGLRGADRLRFTVNCFTRLRYVDGAGRLVLRAKQAPEHERSRALIPWFEWPDARWQGPRIVFGHWSTLGYLANARVLALDTGCVWGGRLTAARIDGGDPRAVSVACAQARLPAAD